MERYPEGNAQCLGIDMEKNTLAEYHKEYQLLQEEKYLNFTLMELFPVLRIVIKVNTIDCLGSLSLP